MTQNKGMGYILGDVLDGNNSDPGASLRILDDIMSDSSVRLILGDHEYWHVLYHFSKQGAAQRETEGFLEILRTMDHTGIPLLRHMERRLSGKERGRYMSFLVECNGTDFIKIGDRFFYLVHSSPCICRDPADWQREITEAPMNMDRDYSQEIDSDPMMKDFLERDKSLRVGKAIVIAGGKPTREYMEEASGVIPLAEKGRGASDGIVKKQRVLVKGKNTLINCGCSAVSLGRLDGGWESDLACLCVDAAGYFVKYLSELNQ